MLWPRHENYFLMLVSVVFLLDKVDALPNSLCFVY